MDERCDSCGWPMSMKPALVFLPNDKTVYRVCALCTAQKLNRVVKPKGGPA